MIEQKIGDSELQELFEKHGVTWTVDENHAKVPCLSISFPVPGDLESQATSCPGCGKEAKIILATEEFPLRDCGMILRFHKIQTYMVSECGFQEADVVDVNKAISQIMDGVDSPISRLFGQCLNGGSPAGIGDIQGKIIGKTIPFIYKYMEEHDIHPRFPSVEKIKEVLASLNNESGPV